MKTAALADFCEIVAGGRRKWTGKDFVEHGFPAYGAGGLNGHLPVAEFNRPAVVLSSIGARCGKCFIAEGEWSSLANTQLIFPDTTKADPRFLWYQLNDEERWPRAGTGQPFIKPSSVKTHRVHLPPLSEQRRIAAVLDAADAIRAKRRQALAKLDTLTQAIFIDMFGEIAATEKLGSHAETVTKGTTPTSVGLSFAAEGIPFVRVQDLAGGTVVPADVDLFVSPETNEALRRSVLRPGDVLVSIAGTIGRVALVPADAPLMNCNQAVALVRVGPSLRSAYLAAWLATEHAQEQMSGGQVTGTISNLSLARIRELCLPIPDVVRQDAFVDRVSAVQVAQSCQLASSASMEKLWRSLQMRAFQGDL